MKPNMIKFWELQLAKQLHRAMEDNEDYDRRETAILKAMDAAKSLGYKSGFGYDNKPEALEGLRLVAYIQLPTGQVSWHMREFSEEYDGHTTEQKFDRIAEFNRKIRKPGQVI